MNNLDKSFLICGAGGLGCFILEGLIRLNVKSITVCDPDIFDESNLNRQLYATVDTLGKKKVDVSFTRAKELGYKGEFKIFPTKFNESLLENIDICIDALDNIESRLYLEDMCEKHDIPLIHGAVGDNIYQVGVALPGKKLLHEIYKNSVEPKKIDTNFVTVSSCASKELSLLFNELEEFFMVYEI